LISLFCTDTPHRPNNGGNGYNPITTDRAGETIFEGASYAARTTRAPGGGGFDLAAKFSGNEASRAKRTVRQPSGSGLEKFCEDHGKKEASVSSAQSRASYLWSCDLRPYTDHQKAQLVSQQRNHRLENPALADAAEDGAGEREAGANGAAAEWRFAPLFALHGPAATRPRRTTVAKPAATVEDKARFPVTLRIGTERAQIACHGGETLAELKAAVAAATGLPYYRLRLFVQPSRQGEEQRAHDMAGAIFAHAIHQGGEVVCPKCQAPFHPAEHLEEDLLAHYDDCMSESEAVELHEAAPVGEQGILVEGLELVVDEDRDAWHHTLDGRLFRAAREGDVYGVREMVLAGANVNSEAKNGDSPLHVAALGAHCQVVSYLFAHGAERDKPNALGHTPLHRAVFALEKGNESLRGLSLMLTNGCDPLLANDEGLTPLHLAASCADILDEATVASAHLMRVHGMEVTTPDMVGITPLLYSIDAKKPVSALWFAVQGGTDVSQYPELEGLIRESGDPELLERAQLIMRPPKEMASNARKPWERSQPTAPAEQAKTGWRR